MMQRLQRINRVFLTFFFSFLLTGEIVVAVPKQRQHLSSAKFQSEDLSKEALMAELTGRDSRRQDDKYLFSQTLSAYQTDNRLLLEKSLSDLLRKFPRSALADNGLYLAGLYHLNHKNFGQAISFFNRVSKEYMHSEKVVSALFAKGMVYKITGLSDLAKSVLNRVIQEYPGSPESLRAGMELRLIK